MKTPNEKENETKLLKKYEEGVYYHQFALTQEIDQKKMMLSFRVVY